MKVTVFGATGFVGRHVVSALKEQGHEVVAVGRERATAGAPVWDAATDELPMKPLRGCEAVVNLIGIKREVGDRTFEAVHVGAVRRLTAAMSAVGVRRLVHVSVVGPSADPSHPYLDSKWRSEQLLRTSGLDVTILRPAVIYGTGDDMLTHLVKMLRFGAIFPVVGDGRTLLQAVDVRDVATAVVRALERPVSIGKTYDVVGPERLALRDVVRRVSDALGLATHILPTPIPLMRAAVAAMNALFENPPSTPSQLRLLERGLVGDGKPAARDLDLATRPLTRAAIAAASVDVPPFLGVSLRLIDGPDAVAWLSHYAELWPRAIGLALLAISLETAASFAPVGIWVGMLAIALILMPCAIVGVRVDWARLFAPRPRAIAAGALAAFALYGAGALIVDALLCFPDTAAQVRTLYTWRSLAPVGLAPLILPVIVLGEDIVWRGAVTLPLAARFGPWMGVLLSAFGFALAHVFRGVPILVAAAFAAGAFWSALTVHRRSLLAPIVSHLLWDATMLFWLPYSG